MNELFILVLGFAVTTLYWWAFKALPSEAWQFIGSVPERPSANCWSSINLTWCGFCSATAYTTGSDLFILLMGSVGVPLRSSHDEAATQHPGPRSGRSAPSAGAAVP